jgi:peptidoglycan/LPS O-acetylase OafA/YrhL
MPWSLSLEEQFYLAWPPLLALLGRKRALALAFTGIAACAIFRFFHWQQYAQTFVNQRTEVRIDALLFGCVFAILLERKLFRDWMTRHAAVLSALAFPPVLWYVYRYQSLIPAGESALLAVLIVGTSLSPHTVASRLLEWKHLKFVGLISYSLYVWQQGMLFISFGEPLGAVFLPLVATLSYILIEQPCIAFGRRCVARLRPPRPNLP